MPEIKRFQGRGWRGNRMNNRTSGQNNNKKYHRPELSPHVSGKQSYFTYATVKQAIIEQVQNNYQYGYDMTKILRNEELVDLGPQELRRLVSIKTESQSKIYEQKGYNIWHEADIQEWIKRKRKRRTYDCNNEKSKEKMS